MISNLPETIDNFDNSVIRKWKPLSLMLILSNVKMNITFQQLLSHYVEPLLKLKLLIPQVFDLYYEICPKFKRTIVCKKVHANQSCAKSKRSFLVYERMQKPILEWNFKKNEKINCQSGFSFIAGNSNYRKNRNITFVHISIESMHKKRDTLAI